MKRKVILISLPFLILFLFLLIPKDHYHVDNGVPTLDIRLKGVDFNTITGGSKETKYEHNKVITHDKKRKVYRDVTVKGRGNHTWTLEKKPFQLAFSKKVSLFGLPESKKFILLANHIDHSLVRNDFTFRVAEDLGMEYSVHGVFVDLYVDKEYIGNYYVVPKIDIHDGILSLKDPHAVLVELDNHYYEEEKNYFESSFHDFLVLKDSFSKDDFLIFQEKYLKMEEAIAKKDFSSLEKIVDIDSFVKFFLIADFANNADVVISSTFFYLDGPKDKIHIGPVWDYDISYGMMDKTHKYHPFYLEAGSYLNDGLSSSLFYRLYEMEEFQEKLKELWNTQGSAAYQKEIKQLEKTCNDLSLSGEYNHQKYDILKYKMSCSILKKWVSDRYQDFSSRYGDIND